MQKRERGGAPAMAGWKISRGCTRDGFAVPIETTW
jgi:hypothetical protein